MRAPARLLAEMPSEWGYRVMILKMDLTDAFGSIRHDDVVISLCDRVGPATASGILQPVLRGCTWAVARSVSRKGVAKAHRTPPPMFWIVVLDDALGDTAGEWIASWRWAAEAATPGTRRTQASGTNTCVSWTT